MQIKIIALTLIVYIISMLLIGYPLAKKRWRKMIKNGWKERFLYAHQLANPRYWDINMFEKSAQAKKERFFVFVTVFWPITIAYILLKWALAIVGIIAAGILLAIGGAFVLTWINKQFAKEMQRG